MEDNNYAVLNSPKVYLITIIKYTKWVKCKFRKEPRRFKKEAAQSVKRQLLCSLRPK